MGSTASRTFEQAFHNFFSGRASNKSKKASIGFLRCECCRAYASRAKPIQEDLDEGDAVSNSNSFMDRFAKENLDLILRQYVFI
jgi:hypothetical protein